MWKAKSIIGKWQFIYHTNNCLYRGWYLVPSLRIGFIRTKIKYSYEHSFFIKLDFLFFSAGVFRLSQ
jgi:hypothetical protein